MDHVPVKEGDFGIDLEAGGVGNEEAGLIRDPVVDVEKQGRGCLAACGQLTDYSPVKGEDKTTHFVCCLNGPATMDAAVTLTVKRSETAETLSSTEKVGKENRKKSSNKKAPKPPRPPRGPSLDAADQKLMKEISDLAMLKRARIERMRKALKKVKNAKAASPSSGNAIALVFTVLFLFVILFQGFFPSMKHSVAKFEGSPESVGLLDQGLISVQYNPNVLGSYDNGPAYGIPSSREQVGMESFGASLTE